MDHKQIDYLAGYQHEIDYALADGVSLVLRKIRDELDGIAFTADQQAMLDRADETVIINMAELDDIDAGLIADDESKPLTDWWWYLGKIRDLTYPAELLPAHLQAVYAKTEKKRFKASTST